jgi:tetratricopeptide (TPR) repeat protein
MNNSYEWDWPRAERDFGKAIDLSPKYATGHVFYAVFLAGMGRRSEARDQFIRAQELEPLSLPINTWLGIDYYWEGEYDKAIEQIGKAIDIDANFANAHYFISWPYLLKGMAHKAVEELRLGMALSGNNPVMTGALVYALNRDKQHAQAVRLLDTLISLAKARYVSPHNLAIAYLGVGDTANFYRSLEATVSDHAFIITPGVLKIDPVFAFAKQDPRFADLIRKTGLSR